MIIEKHKVVRNVLWDYALPHTEYGTINLLKSHVVVDVKSYLFFFLETLIDILCRRGKNYAIQSA